MRKTSRVDLARAAAVASSAVRSRAKSEATGLVRSPDTVNLLSRSAEAAISTRKEVACLLPAITVTSPWSLFDLVSSFHQITAHKDTVPLTAFCTPTGLYEWRRPTLRAPVRCFAVLRCLLPSCDRRSGWCGPGCSLGGAVGHHQYPRLLPRFHHRCHHRGGCVGHHPHHFRRFPHSGRHHPRSYHLHGCGPPDRGCHRAAVWWSAFLPALPLESATGLGQGRRRWPILRL